VKSATYSHAREHLAQIWDAIEDAQPPVLGGYRLVYRVHHGFVDFLQARYHY
jgi:hypothetical protein